MFMMLEPVPLVTPRFKIFGTWSGKVFGPELDLGLTMF